MLALTVELLQLGNDLSVFRQIPVNEFVSCHQTTSASCYIAEQVSHCHCFEKNNAAMLQCQQHFKEPYSYSQVPVCANIEDRLRLKQLVAAFCAAQKTEPKPTKLFSKLCCIDRGAPL